MNPLYVTAAVATGIAALSDWRTGQMPNRVTLGALALGLFGNAALAFHLEGSAAIPNALLRSFGGALLGAIVPFLLWRARALGGGDLKLFVALGAILGPLLGLEVQMLSFVVGALVVPFRLAWEGRLFATLRRSATLVTNVFVRRENAQPVDEAAMTWFRLGPAIFVGTVVGIVMRTGLRP